LTDFNDFSPLRPEMISAYLLWNLLSFRNQRIRNLHFYFTSLYIQRLKKQVIKQSNWKLDLRQFFCSVYATLRCPRSHRGGGQLRRPSNSIVVNCEWLTRRCASVQGGPAKVSAAAVAVGT